MRGTLSVLLCAAVLVDPPAEADRTFAHVRSDDAGVRTLVTEGYRRSVTFRGIVDEIESLPGVVYIEPTMKLSQGMEGALLHAVAGSPDFPVLRVVLKGHPAGDYAIGLIAHELRHVTEVLRAHATSSPAAMTRFFSSLDAAHRPGVSKLETEGAQQSAEHVLRELQQSPREDAAAMVKPLAQAYHIFLVGKVRMVVNDALDGAVRRLAGNVTAYYGGPPRQTPED